MNKVLLILVCLFVKTAFSQVTDTVKVGFYKSVYLVFDDEPEVVDAGSEHLSVRVKDNKVILQILDLEQWEETTLFIENNGVAYVFIVDHSEELNKFVFNYSRSVKMNKETSSDSIKGDDKNVVLMPSMANIEEELAEKRKIDSVYFLNCLDIVNRPDRIGNRGIVKYKMGYYLRDIVVINDKCYLKFEVQNKSNLMFRKDLENFEVINVKRRIKGGSEQLVNLVPIYQYSNPSEIKGKSNYIYCIVVDKFVLTSDKKLQIQMWELNGSDLDDEGGRKLAFDVFYDDVINATQ